MVDVIPVRKINLVQLKGQKISREEMYDTILDCNLCCMSTVTEYDIFFKNIRIEYEYDKNYLNIES